MIKDKPQFNEIIIDLKSPQGNAFYLLGMADCLSKKLRLNGKAIKKEMMSSDYENLLQVFDKNFGAFVTLYR